MKNFKRGHLLFAFSLFLGSNVNAQTHEKTEAQLRKEKIEQLKKAGDWQTPDIEPIEYFPYYYNVNSIPYFNSESIKFSIYCDNPMENGFRNENVKSIRKRFELTTDLTGRFIKSDSATFDKSKNKSYIQFFLKNLSFPHKGLDADGINLGFQCYFNYKIRMKGYMKNPDIYSNTIYNDYELSCLNTRTYNTKRGAFEAILSIFHQKVRTMIYKYWTIHLQVIAIELDKKGEPSHLVFEKNDLLVEKIGLDILLYEKSNLVLANKKFKLESHLGSFEFKKSDATFEIVCKIKSKKMRETLKPFVDNPTVLNGMAGVF
jgi:hypothetical protein